MLTAKECQEKIEYAIEEFGRYNYYDKGAAEVIDMNVLIERTEDMSAQQVIDLLLEVLKHKHGEEFVRYFVCMIDDREDFDTILENSKLGVYY